MCNSFLFITNIVISTAHVYTKQLGVSWLRSPTWLFPQPRKSYHLDLNFLIEVGYVGQGSHAPDGACSGEAVPSAQDRHGVIVTLVDLQQHRASGHVHHFWRRTCRLGVLWERGFFVCVLFGGKLRREKRSRFNVDCLGVDVRVRDFFVLCGELGYLIIR